MPASPRSTADDDFIIALEHVVSSAPKGPETVYADVDPNSSQLSPSLYSCRYFVNEAPACIIGRTLAYLGFRPDEIHEGLSSSGIMQSLGFSDIIVFAARGAQIVQDRGDTWGEALQRFYREYMDGPDDNYESPIGSY